MKLASIIERYQNQFFQQYRQQLSKEQRTALYSILDCRSERFGQIQLECGSCQQQQTACHSCGHRSCPSCQHYDTSRWLDRQQQKLLPVNYFMVTFTLPYELRSLVYANQTVCLNSLFNVSVGTLRSFFQNSAKLGGGMGCTTVLHTHSRRLEFHPHVHMIVPGGCINKRRKQWKKLKGEYLFNAFALAKVFRGRFLAALRRDGFSIPAIPAKKWVVDCKFVGKGLPALTYLARYLYRGVINENNIVQDDGRYVTFRYKESRSGQFKTRTLKGPEFIWLLLIHVLPKGFRRSRDYGFIHGNAKKILFLIQQVLRVIHPPSVSTKRPAFRCPRCKTPMNIVGFIPRIWKSG